MDAKHDGCRTGWMQGRMDAKHDGCRTGLTQDIIDSGQDGCRTIAQPKASYFGEHYLAKIQSDGR